MYFETTAAGGISWEEVQEAQLKGGAEGGQDRKSRRKLKISIPKWCGKWVVSMDEYKDGVVGAKSKNLAGLRNIFSLSSEGYLNGVALAKSENLAGGAQYPVCPQQ